MCMRPDTSICGIELLPFELKQQQQNGFGEILTSYFTFKLCNASRRPFVALLLL